MCNIITCKVPSKPMIAVGSKARHAQWANGYQYQNWQNNTMPTMAFVLRLPALLCKLMVTLRPPASIRPCPKAAPKRAIGSSCLSATIFAYKARVDASDGVDASDCSTRTIPSAMKAPWRTKSTLSLVIGSKISTASCIATYIRKAS